MLGNAMGNAMRNGLQAQPGTHGLPAHLLLPLSEYLRIQGSTVCWSSLVRHFLSSYRHKTLLIQTALIISLLVGRYLERMNKICSKSQKEAQFVL